jgi:tetratricopeptide (TPR) repeat protein
MITLLLAFALTQAAQDCGKSFAAGFEEYKRKDLSKALIAFRAAVQCDPKMAPAYLAIADIYAERGNESEALGALLQALQIEPKNELALRAASNLYLKKDLHDKALPLLETLASAAPKAADVHADLAAVYAASGDRKRA